ncbi:TetR/AcrR family transcriptional regulator [Paenibacillus glycanilyticus]|uniref:TetR family transcriptional regulator n=1 Tax=Paenibacillus glycanilyticus TaxID=126569 RepID=A0ABQ6GG54_9BACL|nr:TetR/AcrR family transcriptional regulator C-terminal domain-containing protein [Paenibacillus glycanilyticus]GLX69924.1 TetR family transcriptional regulator [Paenibacillus glycanilyticus]
MSEKIDRRKAKTKQQIYESLMVLIAEKGVEHVNVTDITNHANLNRGTFYLHYKDVPDMLQQLQDHVFNSIEQYVKQLDFRKAMEYGDRREPYPLGVQIFKEFAKHADFLKVMFGPKGDLAYALQFRKLMAQHIYQKIDMARAGHLNIRQDYVVAYMTSAHFGMLMHWIECDLDQTPEQMSIIMLNIVNYGPLVSFGLKEMPPIKQ